MYDQLEVIPIYQAFILFSWCSIGLFLYNEYQFYTTENICGLFGSGLVCLAGVKALTMKHSVDQSGEEEEIEGEKDLAKGIPKRYSSTDRTEHGIMLRVD